MTFNFFSFVLSLCKPKQPGCCGFDSPFDKKSSGTDLEKSLVMFDRKPNDFAERLDPINIVAVNHG